jgi:hypothetical protein
MQWYAIYLWRFLRALPGTFPWALAIRGRSYSRGFFRDCCDGLLAHWRTMTLACTLNYRVRRDRRRRAKRLAALYRARGIKKKT